MKFCTHNWDQLFGLVVDKAIWSITPDNLEASVM